jgi:hypothetical protein
MSDDNDYSARVRDALADMVRGLEPEDGWDVDTASTLVECLLMASAQLSYMFEGCAGREAHKRDAVVAAFASLSSVVWRRVERTMDDLHAKGLSPRTAAELRKLKFATKGSEGN